MKIVFLDRRTIGEDLDLSGFQQFGEVVTYGFSTPEEALERTMDADVIVINKVAVNEASIGKAQKLKLVCATGTGTNHLDKEYLAKKGIAWRNVAGYSTQAVAQHTMALLLNLYEHLAYYDNYVKSETYVNDHEFIHYDEKNFHEVNGKTWGIVGLGNIGRRVAELAECFGAEVVYYSTTGRNHDSHYEEVSWETLLTESDIISVHAPLTEETLHLFDEKAFRKMKNSAVFINVGRGAIVVEKDLARALRCGEIAAAGLDVLEVEPMSPDNPLVDIKNSDRLLITPHIAWAAVESRERLMKIIVDQIKEYFYANN